MTRAAPPRGPGSPSQASRLPSLPSAAPHAPARPADPTKASATFSHSSPAAQANSAASVGPGLPASSPHQMPAAFQRPTQYTPSSPEACVCVCMCVHRCVHVCVGACVPVWSHAVCVTCACTRACERVHRQHVCPGRSEGGWETFGTALGSQARSPALWTDAPWALVGTLTAAPLESRPAAFLPPAASTPGKMEPLSTTSVASGRWAWTRTRPREWCTCRAVAPHSASGCAATSGPRANMPSWSWWSRGQSSCWPSSWCGPWLSTRGQLGGRACPLDPQARYPTLCQMGPQLTGGWDERPGHWNGVWGCRPPCPSRGRCQSNLPGHLGMPTLDPQASSTCRPQLPRVPFPLHCLLTCKHCWGLLSECKPPPDDFLVSVCLPHRVPGKATWPARRARGEGDWVRCCHLTPTAILASHPHP